MYVNFLIKKNLIELNICVLIYAYIKQKTFKLKNNFDLLIYTLIYY